MGSHLVISNNPVNKFLQKFLRSKSSANCRQILKSDLTSSLFFLKPAQEHDPPPIFLTGLKIFGFVVALKVSAQTWVTLNRCVIIFPFWKGGVHFMMIPRKKRVCSDLGFIELYYLLALVACFVREFEKISEDCEPSQWSHLVRKTYLTS